MAMNPMEQFEVRPIVPLHIGPYDVSFTNQSLFMCIVVAAVTLFLTFAMSGRRLVPSRTQSMAELSYEFVAGMIRSTAGDKGLVFFPFVFAIFMFVLFSNFLGLIPGAFTVTSQIIVTFALTALVMLTVVVVGFAKHGFKFLMLFVPKAPWYLLPLLVPIEVISFLTRLVSLSVRLFANMLAGHTMLAVFASFVVALGAAGGILSALSITPMFMIIFIVTLELLVA
ncbi:MAG: F0F1 ATP synthase subunit A, partial [Alphaproteobacteria bacterium]|nr:F0F1 ATP synthase subunit A [Alphaproteobacteria bacterium]